MGVDEVEAGRRSPMSEKAGLDMFRPKRLTQKRIVHEVDLADGQIVGGPPVAVDEFEFALGRRWAAMFRHVRSLKPVAADDFDCFFGDHLFLVGRNDEGDDFAFPRADHGRVHLVRELAQRETQPAQMVGDATAYFRLMLADAAW